VAVTSVDEGGAADLAKLVVGDVLIRFNGEDIHDKAQKDVVPMFAKAGTNPIKLHVKSVGLAFNELLCLSIVFMVLPLSVILYACVMALPSYSFGVQFPIEHVPAVRDVIKSGTNVMDPPAADLRPPELDLSSGRLRMASVSRANPLLMLQQDDDDEEA
jgi:hypothetical protein